MRAQWRAIALLTALALAGEASATPPPPDPETVRFGRDLEAVDLEECNRLATRQRRFVFVVVAGIYDRDRRPRFDVSPRYGAPSALVACVRDRFRRYQQISPSYQGGDAFEPARRPGFKAYRWLTLGERRYILPPGRRVVSLLREQAIPNGAHRTLGAGIALTAGRCLIARGPDPVNQALSSWREANFPDRLPDGEDDFAEGERFRVDDRWHLDFRFGIEGGFIVCLVPTGKLAHHLTQLRDQLDAWSLLADGLDRRPVHVTWTVDGAGRARRIDACAEAPLPGLSRAPARVVAKLRGELAKLLAGEPLPGVRPGETFLATFGPWHGLSLRRLSEPPSLPAGCQR